MSLQGFEFADVTPLLEPLSIEKRELLIRERYPKLSAVSLTQALAGLEVNESGNVILAAMATGEEIDFLLESLDPARKLFVVEPSREAWAAALSRPSVSTWPIGERLFAFRNGSSLSRYLDTKLDLMPPTTLLTLHEADAALSGLSQMLNECHSKRSLLCNNLTRQLTARTHSGKSSQKTWGALLPNNSRESALLELALQSLQENGDRIFLLGRDTDTPLQMTPAWLLHEVVSHEITDFIAVNRCRRDLEQILPEKMGWTCLIADPLPEVFSPQPEISLSANSDNYLPLNTAMAGALTAKGHPVEENFFWPRPQSPLPWNDRTIDCLVIGDAPGSVFLTEWQRHPTLAPLSREIMAAMEAAPPFPRRCDLELIFLLCEKRCQVYIQDQKQKEWLITLIHEHVVAEQNRRKVLLDFHRHVPDLTLGIYGRGWEADAELAPYVIIPKGAPMDLLRRSRCYLSTEGLENRFPDPLTAAALSVGCCLLLAQPKNSDQTTLFEAHRDYLPWSSLQEIENLGRELKDDPARLIFIAQSGHRALNHFQNQHKNL